MKRLIGCIFLLLLSFTGKAGFQKDSIALATIYAEALQHPDQLDAYIRRADQLFKKKQQTREWKATYFYLKARFFVQIGQLESGIKTANLGLKLYGKREKGRAKYYNLIGSIVAYKQDYNSAISNYQKALELLENSNDELQAAYIKNNIANTFFSLTDYPNAYSYAKEAYLETKALNDTVYMPSIAGVLAVSEIKLGYYEAAFEHAQECLNLSRRYRQPLGLIIGNYCFGDYYLEKRDYKKATQHYVESLNFAMQFRQNQYIMLAKVGLLSVNIEVKNFPLAITYGEDALKETDLLKNGNTLYSIYKKLAVAYNGVGESRKAFLFMQKAHLLYSKNASSENRKAINELLIKYKTEKNEKALAKQALKVSQQNALIAWLIAGLIFVGFVVFFLIRRHRIKLNKESDLREKQTLRALMDGEDRERLRLSQEIHDGMSSALGGIQLKLSIEAKQNEQLQQLVAQLQVVQEDARRMAHNLLPLTVSEKGWEEALEQFCKENSSEVLRIVLFSNRTKKSVDQRVGQIVFRIVQELVHNCIKHAHASECFVNILEQDDLLRLTVEDNGRGFDMTNVETFQGLSTIDKRLKLIQSTLTIDSSVGNGSFFSIEIPLANFD